MGEKAWLIQVNDLIANVPTKTYLSQRRSIYKLPACVTDLNEPAYRPLVVSFGPYHYRDENLKPMEEHKDRALVQFLKRSAVPPQYYFNSLAEVVQELKDSYDSLDPALQRDNEAFLRIMIRDGCFMLEILRFCVQNINGYDSKDPVFSKHGKLYVIPYIKRDMLKLENQLPMLVLHKLLQVERGLAKVYPSIYLYLDKENEQHTKELVLKFFFGTSDNAPSKCLHILDLYRSFLLGSTKEIPQNKKNLISKCGDYLCHNIISKIRKTSDRKGSDDIIRSARELHEAGIEFNKSKTHFLNDITFDNGNLSLPMIVVDDTTESQFLNLIAFERFHVGAGNEVTAYVFFMDNIIDDALDISLLHSKKIIQNGIGSDKAAAKMFNSLSKDITLDQNECLGTVYRQVNDYCENFWPRNRAYVCHTYLTNPWVFLSVLAAIFLFALTIVQTVYTALAYHHGQ